MNKKLAAALVAVTSVGMTLPAVAADLLIMDEPVYAAPAYSSDWEGMYVGGFLGYIPDFDSAIVGVQIGYNFLPTESFLLGLEGSGLIYLDGTSDTEFFVHAKAGVAIDNFAVYALAGLGVYEFNLALWDVGVGAEVKVTDEIGLFAEGFLREEFGETPDVAVGQVGLRFHF